MREKGYIAVQTVLLPETLNRFETVMKKRGFNTRSKALKEAICDYIAKHEHEGSAQ